MGLFDSLKNLGLDKIVDSIGESIESAAERVNDAVNNNPSDSSGYAQQNTQYAAPQNAGYAAPQSAENFAPQDEKVDVVQKFEQIFATDFADLQVTKEASPESVGIAAPGPCRPYSYALWRGGQPALVIMLTPHNRDHNAAFMNAKAAATNSNVAFLNFYTHFLNERNYVVSRIRSAL